MKQDRIIEWIEDKHGWKIRKTKIGFRYNFIPISRDKLFNKLKKKAVDRFMLCGTAEEDYANDAVSYFINSF